MIPWYCTGSYLLYDTEGILVPMKTDEHCEDRWVCKSGNLTEAHSSMLMVLYLAGTRGDGRSFTVC